MMKSAMLAFVLLAALALPAAAQTRRPPPKKSSIGLRAYGVVDTTTMAATESFKASFGSAQTFGAGGGAELDIWKHLFLRFAVTRSQEDGTRVFVDNGEVFDLNIPMTVTMTPIEAGGGWRFVSRSRLTPYIGGAFISMAFNQVSDFAQAGENVSERYTGEAGFGGVDVMVWKGLFVGGEAQYRHVTVPDASTSVMTAFGERNLGGFTARILIGYGSK
jgi:hypothetical protein